MNSTVRRAAAIGALLASTGWWAACASERGDYTPPSYDVTVTPPDASTLDLQPVDLPPLPRDADGAAVDLPDAPAPADSGDTGGRDGATEISTDVGELPPALSPRECSVTLTFQGSADAVYVPGELNEWSEAWGPEHPHAMTAAGADTWTLSLSDVPPGRYAYKLYVETSDPGAPAGWMLDPANPRRKWVSDVENSALVVPDCELPLAVLESVEADATTGNVEVWVAFADGAGATGILPESVTVRRNGVSYGNATYYPEAQRLRIVVIGASVPSKHSFVVEAANDHGASQPLFVPVWLEERPFAWTDAVMYFLFVDRFANGDATNDAQATCDGGTVWEAADWQGGDWAGAREKIESGWFDRLGVNAIWLTAPVDNPSSCGRGTIADRWYSSYHGYHPSALRTPEEHFGTLEELHALVDTAHEHGIRVLVDAVVNHVHEDHPWFRQNPEWFNYSESGNIQDLICGSGCGGECWQTAPIECWFTDYLPDLDYRADGAAEAMVDDLRWWAMELGLDGFRVDAVKHVEDTLLYELRAMVDEELQTTGDVFYMVGETFTGGGADDIALLRRYINDRMLHGQFNFPLYWDILDAFATGTKSLSSLASRVSELQTAFGEDAVMSTFLGNHDVPRLLSKARGDGTDPASPPNQPQPTDPGLDELFGRIQLAFGFLMTAPGIPLVYYGDEVGLVGGSDPDNRRMMQFGSFADPHQDLLLSFVRQVGQARRDHRALRRGDFRVLEGSDDHLAFARVDGDAVALAFLNRNPSAAWNAQVAVASLGLGDGTVLHDPVGGGDVTVGDGSVGVQVPRLGASGFVLLLTEHGAE